MGRGEHEETTALINASRAILEREHPTTVRRVVYELFNQKHITTTDKGAENRVSRLLTIARKDGRIRWEWIVDEHRHATRPLTFRDKAEAIRFVKSCYRKDYWPAQPVMVTIWSEKSTVEGILKPTLEEYEVGFLPVHGNNSTSKVREASDAQIRDGRPWVILYVGDWDPSGCYMSDVDAPRRTREYGADITIKRVALLPQDVTALSELAFDVDDKRMAAIRKHGADKVGKRGIDNNKPWFMARYGRACMELDAMNSNDLRASGSRCWRPQRAQGTGATEVRKVAWSQRTTWTAVQRRAGGRAQYNSLRTFRATLRRGEVLRLLQRWGWRHGVQAALSRHFGVSEATISRDLAVILPLFREGPDGELVPRYWYDAR